MLMLQVQKHTLKSMALEELLKEPVVYTFLFLFKCCLILEKKSLFRSIIATQISCLVSTNFLELEFSKTVASISKVDPLSGG
jgi:hypothetical protein